MSSKLEAQRTLQLPRIADRAGDGAHLRVADIRIRQAELRMIEDVEGFRAELNFHLFPDGEVFEERHVPVPAARSKQDVAPGIAISVGGRTGKCAG